MATNIKEIEARHDEIKRQRKTPDRGVNGATIWSDIYIEDVAALLAEHKRLTAELADIGKRLKGFPESQLDGEHGLAASTMVCYERLEEENEKLRVENELLKKSIDLLTPPEHPTVAECANKITGIAGGEDDDEKEN